MITSINDIVKGLKVYPNPANSVINVPGGDVVEIEVFDVFGNRMNVNMSATQIDVSYLASGVYILKQCDRATRFVKK